MAEDASRRSPYLGLASFGDGDAALFFGRDAERDLIIANLRAARLTVLYGPGGVGKSSLLHAGVVHRLREMEAAQRADADDDETRPRTDVVIVDDWGGDERDPEARGAVPEARLIAAIRGLSDDAAAPPPDDDAGLDDGGSAVLRAAKARRARAGGALLIILDQFEEYIRLNPGPQEHGFDEALAELVRDQDSGARVLIAIREDRLADLDRFAGRIPQLMGNLLRLGPLSPEAALDAIEKPIEYFAATTKRDVALEPGLATAVRDGLVALNERRRSQRTRSGSDDGRRPSVDSAYLQLVMRRLWDTDIEANGDTRIRNATLEALGGVDEIIATHLDTALDRLPQSEQDLTADMLRFLVTPSGATACLTARDLAEYTGRSEAELEALAEKLSRPPARILRGADASDGGTHHGGYELPPVLAEPAAEWAVRRRTLGLERRTRRLLLGLASMIAIAIALSGYTLEPDRVRSLEIASVDARFDVRGAQGSDPRIAFVTRARSPRNPRSRMARALRAIATADPRSVALNINYQASANPARHDDPAAADRALVSAVNGPLKDRLVISTFAVEVEVVEGQPGGPSQRVETELFGRGRPLFQRPAVAWDGLPLDPGRIIRRITPAATFVPVEATGAKTVQVDRLAVVAARLAQDPDPKLPANAWIDFRGPRKTFSRIALDDVVARRPRALAKLRDKVVLVGYTDDKPLFRTSAPGAGEMDTTEIQANAISTALDGFPLRDSARGVDIALIVLLGLLPLALARALRRRPPRVAGAGLLAAALFCAAAQVTFAGGWVIAIVMPLASLALASLAVTVLLWRLPEPGTRRAPIATGGDASTSPAPRDTFPAPAGQRPAPSSR